MLALQVSSGDTGDDGALAMQLEVASVATGRLTAVPGTFASSDALVGFGWPASEPDVDAQQDPSHAPCVGYWIFWYERG